MEEKLLIEKLGRYTRATKLEAGRDVYAYRCHSPVPSSPGPPSTVVAWYEDGRGQLPGDPEPRTDVALPTRAARATVVPMITDLGQQTAKSSRSIAVAGGRIRLTLGETPVLVEEYE